LKESAAFRVAEEQAMSRLVLLLIASALLAPDRPEMEDRTERFTALLSGPGIQADEPAARSQPGKAEDVVRRLRRELEGARAGLEQSDAGPETRALQKKILDDLDRLIDRQRDPSGDGQPKAADQRSRPEPKANDVPPKPRTADSETDVPLRFRPNGQGTVQSKAGQLNDGEWSRLPYRQRQALDQYAGDRFMPAYEELLRQYYRAVIGRD
jgi:hypothetical protein